MTIPATDAATTAAVPATANRLFQKPVLIFSISTLMDSIAVFRDSISACVAKCCTCASSLATLSPISLPSPPPAEDGAERSGFGANECMLSAIVQPFPEITIRETRVGGIQFENSATVFVILAVYPKSFANFTSSCVFSANRNTCASV